MKKIAVALSCFLTFVAEPMLASEPTCPTCVEDVVLETTTGEWRAGYISWSQPPFRYLDLENPRDLEKLSVIGGGRLELWPHAVAFSIGLDPERLAFDLSDNRSQPSHPARLPEIEWLIGDSKIPRMAAGAPATEIALLIGQPVSIPLPSVRRIYPRIGSGLPSFRITRDQLGRLAENHLPFATLAGGGCSGCPMTVEDVTVILTSGELVSGVMQWHAASHSFEGYDFRDGKQPTLSRSGAAVLADTDPELRIWSSAVSAPRRTFETHAALDYFGKLDIRPGFTRVTSTVLLTETPKSFRASEVDFVLPGPSRSAQPLLLPRNAALQLLQQQPSLVMESNRDRFYLYCFSYSAVATIQDLAQVCDAWAIETLDFSRAGLRPNHLVARTPGPRIDPPGPTASIELLTLFFDGGT